MSTLTIRLPDAKHERLKDLARSKRVSVNKLFEEWATIALVQQEALVSYELSKSRGDRARGLQLLDQLDTHFKSAA
jgi:predicted transcriptional regulator